MRNIVIKYSYDGSKFSGFQRQNDKKTVQGRIEEVISIIFKEEINLISSGRTDLGVHAIEQVSNFYLKNDNIKLKNIIYALNKSLNNEIIIKEIFETNENFNSRYNAKTRSYKYILKTFKNLTPFENDYVTIIKDDIDIEKFSKMAKIFLGKHDFASFMKLNKDVKTSIREIYNIELIKVEDRYELYIVGNAFLHAMVRIITGSLLATYFGDVDEKYIENRLKNPNVNLPKILANPNGLYLYKVEY